MLADFEYFLRVGRESQWKESIIDLSADAAAWPDMDPDLRDRTMRFVAGFAIAEWAVANELGAFADVIDHPRAAQCFTMQDGDEARHSRFFDRLVDEVAQIPGETRDERRRAVRQFVDPQLLELFEVTLPERAARVSEDRGLHAAVGLYHMVLEGVVLTAGQFAFLELLEGIDVLPGLKRGVELVQRDERWHVGFGARCIQELDLSPHEVEHILDEGQQAVTAWGPLVGPEHTDRMRRLHTRRLRAAGLLPTPDYSRPR